jgi:hypothetical protein
MSGSGLRPGDRLAGLDFAAHNADAKRAMDAWNAGRPTRTPIVLGVNSRYFLASPAANPEGLDFQRYSEDADAMFDALLRFQRWSRFNLLQDAELGLPEEWVIAPDFQNYYEAAWFGCPIHYMDGQVPDTRPAFADAPERVMEKGLPGPFDGIMGRALRYYERFRERAERETFLGRPIRAIPPGCGGGTDGPMTVACNLFGAGFACAAMAEEPDRLQRLFAYITEANLRRIAAWRALAGVQFPQENYWFADDSVALISTAMYRERVMPWHRKLLDAFAGRERGIHLCGDATRHFPCIREGLGITGFDTGFPVDFGRLRRELGPRVRLQGGPHVEFLRTAAPAEVFAETKRVLGTGVLDGGLFLLREGNNLAPGTPVENTEAMYLAGREFGWKA